MRQGIHPEYQAATITCSCGNKIETRSTTDDIHVEICSVCHPFYTGKQRLVDTAGRVERFKRKYGEKQTAKAGKAAGAATATATAESDDAATATAESDDVENDADESEE